MQKKYSKYVFIKNDDGSITRELLDTANPVRGPELLYRHGPSIENNSAQGLLISGIWPSGCDIYWTNSSIWDILSEFGFVKYIQNIGAKVMVYISDTTSTHFGWNQNPGFSNWVHLQFQDNSIYIGDPAREHPMWAVPTQHSGLVAYLRPRDIHVASGVDIPWVRIESLVTTNTYSGIATFTPEEPVSEEYENRHHRYRMDWVSGDTFDNFKFGYMLRSSHDWPIPLWNRNLWMNILDSGVMQRHTDLVMPFYVGSGIYGAGNNPDWYMFDGPVEFEDLANNRDNPSGLVPGQTEADNQTFPGDFASIDSKYEGYFTVSGVFDGNDLDTTTLCGAPPPTFNRSSAQHLYHRRTYWIDRLQKYVDFLGEDNLMLNDPLWRFGGKGHADVFNPENYVPGENMYHRFRNTRSWHEGGKGTITTNKDTNYNAGGIWSYINQYGADVYFTQYLHNWLSTNTPIGLWSIPANRFTQCISIMCRGIWALGTGENNRPELENNYFNNQDYYYKFELDDPIGRPYQDGNYVKQEYLNGSISLYDGGGDIQNRATAHNYVDIVQYPRTFPISKLYGEWYADQHVIVAGMYPAIISGYAMNTVEWSGVGPIATAPYNNIRGPGIAYNEFNSMSALVFSGQNILTIGDTNINWDSFTIYIVAKMLIDSVGGWIIRDHNATGEGSISFGTLITGAPIAQSKYQSHPAGNFVFGSPIALDTYHIYVYQYQNQDERIYVDGYLNVSSILPSGKLLGDQGTGYETTICEPYARCNLAALIICSGFHETEERERIGSFLSKKYKL